MGCEQAKQTPIVHVLAIITHVLAITTQLLLTAITLQVLAVPTQLLLAAITPHVLAVITQHVLARPGSIVNIGSVHCHGGMPKLVGAPLRPPPPHQTRHSVNLTTR